MRNDIISQNIELIDGKVIINDKKLFEPTQKYWTHFYRIL